MIVFQVSLNFDQAKEMLKITCHIFILMKKLIVLRKKTSFTPLFSTIEKKIYISTLKMPIYYIQH